MAEKITWFIEYKYLGDANWYKFGIGGEPLEYDVRSEASAKIQELRDKEAIKKKNVRQFRLNSR
jgi:hypothetical protein